MPEELGHHPLNQLLLDEKDRTCGQASMRNYASQHSERFQDVLRICISVLPDPQARVLDVGRSELTAHLRIFYGNIHTLGFDPSIDDGGHREAGSSLATVPHITYDLLNSNILSGWPQSEPFDLIVFSEVIEHLSVAPEFVFGCLASLLNDNGVLLCTTPNGADLAKRVTLALGRNPYERLRLYTLNPGHIREYTRNELCEISASVGLSCDAHFYFNWLGRGRNRLKTGILKLLLAYPPFRRFQLCVFTKSPAVSA